MELVVKVLFPYKEMVQDGCQEVELVARGWGLLLWVCFLIRKGSKMAARGGAYC